MATWSIKIEPKSECVLRPYLKSFAEFSAAARKNTREAQNMPGFKSP